MNATGGFAKIWRAVLGHPAFRNRAEEAAFMWLIAMAAWQPARVRYKGKAVHLKRGQLALSVRDFAAGFGWSKGVAERFFDRLKAETMIGTDVGTGVQIITICNYDIYQGTLTEAGTGVGTPVGTRPGQRRDTEQRKEERKKDSLADKSAQTRTLLSDDWKPPAIADLPPKAQEAAKQWPREAYETQAESFKLYWKAERKTKADWPATWANWIHRAHWRVMQDARRGGRDSGGDKPYYKLVAEGRA